MADVFLSYKREDAARVTKLVAALRSAGLDLWWDQDIPPSAPWEATIERALAEAKAVIVCWSPHAVASENVRSEARVARKDGRLIQLFLKPCQPPLFFGERQGIDLSSWRGKPDDPQIGRIAETARRVAAGERIDFGEHPKRRRAFDLRAVAAGIAALLLIALASSWSLLRSTRTEGPDTLAVLPFRALNPADANLVDAIWDDTRGAISRNPNLRVLGRQAVEALAKKNLEPADLRRKVGADYLLDGSVQHAGDRIEMKLSLVRTQDSAEVWSDRLGGRLDDVFAFQTRIANEVEGRIRGRVAPGGGATAKNIATTGEVYALYAEARSKTRQRDSINARAGAALLKKALAIDPNYAPAWAELGMITGMGISRTPERTPSEQEREAVSYLTRALQLAPNLAHAHAALAMVQNFPPELAGELKKAVKLDPNDADAWNWLGNYYKDQNRVADALAAHSRAAAIEPLWISPVGNKILDLAMERSFSAIDSELARIKARGDPILLAKSEATAAGATGKPADLVNVLLRLRIDHPEEASWVDNRIFAPLMQLGFVEEALAAWHLPPEIAPNYRGIADAPELIRAGYRTPRDVWEDDDAMALFGRLLPKQGRLREYVGYYDAAFKSPEELVAFDAHRPGIFFATAPTLAADLRLVARDDEADAILRHADELLQPRFGNGIRDPGDVGALARVRAAQGRDDEAMALLRESIELGDLPDRMFQPVDIADEPAFAHLRNRPDFQGLRRGILARLDNERRKVDVALLARSGLSLKAAT